MTPPTTHDAAELLGIPQQSPPPPAPSPAATIPLPVPAGPVDLAALLGLTDPAQVHEGVPQAQGDVLVLPWPPHTAPTLRERAIRSAGPVPATGLVVVRGRGGHTHTLLADGPAVRAGHDRDGDGLAVVVVDPGSVAVLAHEVHLDLHIGSGTYVLRRQRRHTPADPQAHTAYVED